MTTTAPVEAAVAPELARDLTSRFGSPLYLIFEAVVRDRYRRFARAFANAGVAAKIAYSVKTNYLTAVCRVLEEEGAHAEIVSGFEYEIARRAGFDDARIVFNGPYKTPDELQLAGRVRLNVESIEEIDAINALGAERNETLPIGVRLNLPIGDVPWSRFGFGLVNGEAAAAIARIRESPGVRLAGLHAHIGTNLTNPDAYVQSCRLLSAPARQLIEDGDAIEYIDLGGGFAAPHSRLYTIPEEDWVPPSIEAHVAAIASTFDKAWGDAPPRPMLFIEPGRSLVSESGVVLTTVVSRRETETGVTVTTDGGINIVPSAQGIAHEMRNLTRPDGARVPTDVYGPMCMNVDALGRGITLSEPQVGDVLGVFDTGAYDFAHSIQFIRLRPAVVSIADDGSARLVRRAETPDDMFALEC